MKTNYETALDLLNIISKKGYDAYIVGGYVRDKILNIDTNDIDITTNAKPEVISSMFEKVIPTGIKFGTVTVIYNDYKYEVTTFRSDGKYSDNRRPDDICFSDNIEDDLVRRDFTMNALVINKDGNILDLYHGIEDINCKTIKAIGNPKLRFEEDSLRILRAFRFVSKLGFDIDLETFDAIIKTQDLIKNLPSERLYNEINKIFANKYTYKAITLMVKAGIHKLLPGLEKGLEFLANKKVDLSILEYWALCFKLNNEIVHFWKISNKDKFFIKKSIELSNTVEEGVWNKLQLFTYQLPTALMANNINYALGITPDLKEKIIEIDNSLEIRATCDLKFKGQDVWKLTNNVSGPWIHGLVDDIKFQVLMGLTPNDRKALKEFTIKRMKELGLGDLINEDK